MALNPDDILKEQFPDNVSISDLCDCGKHKRRNQGGPPFPRKSGPCPDSDYMATFKGITQRPRSSKRPMTEVPFARIPREPMMLDTNQRSDFRSHGHIERTKPIIPQAEKFNMAAVSVKVRKNSNHRLQRLKVSLHIPRNLFPNNCNQSSDEWNPDLITSCQMLSLKTEQQTRNTIKSGFLPNKSNLEKCRASQVQYCILK